ncbi:hypothetical protein L202_06929 [Cryptococcus amylolentus CBS 6039]|uniref:Mid2 domain-containing protein n=1 Tax=Cryptococcus amylolentus CBS 6039 TaxID=1295533 RepID=A0A1E3HDZ6_9TREE|nr:hypothetical protein L202_06929 [Cryptococcus amylolentus CBS 6039]ODN74563.1 hypothetical protein L202_06929 [Cryptococcus amylolentus CBS 6039]
MPRLPLLLATATLALLPGLSAFSFSFSHGPASCGQAVVKWSGGQSPYSLTIIPAYDYPTTVSIPDSAYDDASGTGSYNWTANYPSGTQFVAMMSDNSGTGTGGVSELFNISSASSKSSCDMRSEETDFLFYLNETSLTQCQGVEVYWDDSAVSPVSIIGAIPGGQVFQLVSSDEKTTSMVWSTNVQAGTDVIFAAFDSGTHLQGGTSDILTIQGSGDNSCIDDSSPSSTPAASTATQTGASGGTKTNAGGVKTVTAVTTQTASAASGAAGLSTGAIVGIVMSAVVVVGAIQIALLWFCCRKQIRALIYHRKEMRGAEIKPSGGVDLGLASRASFASGRENDTGMGELAGTERRGSRYSTVRSHNAGDDFDAASSISPFWDGAAAIPPSGSVMSLNALGNGRPPTIGSLGFDSDGESLRPPRGPFGRDRNDSLSSFTLTIPETIDESGQPSPAYEAAHPSPALSNSSNSPLVPTSAALGGRGNMSKAQMAASLSAQNAEREGERDVYFGARVPPPEAPPGGFRRHVDAGAVEDLPPMYRPEWENSPRNSQHERE